MLIHLHIRDFAIIDEIELDFGSGMTALTGETGAGKSILLDALGLVLGDRADSTTVREGARRAEISAEFDLAGHEDIREWLASNDLDDDGACQLRRVIGSDGRSRGFINGRPSPLTTMRELGERLVDIHGQHEHQSLRHREAQRDLVDHHADHEALRQAVVTAHATWRDACDRLERLGGMGADREERLDLLRYQVQELETLDLGGDEIAALDAEHRRLANAGQLLEACQRALALLHDDESSAQTLVARVGSELTPVVEHDQGLQEAGDLVESARIQIDEATGALRSVADSVELDPARLEWVEQRLGAIHDLARKHRVEPADLATTLETLRAELDELEHADEHAARLEQEIEQARTDWRTAADHLSASRHQAATALAEAVTAQMQALSMVGGSFTVALDQRDAAAPTPAGYDRVEFRVAANPGQSPAPLHRVASGGELSRISLAIQMVASDQAGIPTQIFDEVDAGIGGRTAAMVGAKLRALAARRQVLCVTHLPQVAAHGHHHLRVAKESVEAGVQTQLEELADDQRVEEIARMLGGERITERSRDHAREMLAGDDQLDTG